MNEYGFAASVISSLVWPATLVVLVLILKKPIGELLPRLRGAKYKDLELDFAERAQDAREVALAEIPQTVMEALPPVPLQAPVRLPEQNPRAMVLEAWLQVEAAAVDAARRLGGQRFGDIRRSSEAIRFLERSDMVNREAVATLRDLRGMRNEAVHVPDFDVPDVAAIDYALAAAALIDYFRSIQGGA